MSAVHLFRSLGNIASKNITKTNENEGTFFTKSKDNLYIILFNASVTTYRSLEVKTRFQRWRYRRDRQNIIHLMWEH